MKYKKFSDKIWQKIESELDASLDAAQKSSSSFPVAAFDADGTLWDTDLGENLFKYQIKQNILPALKSLPKDPWTYYSDWKESGDPRPAYLWLAQINSGASIKDVKIWAEEAVQKHSPLPIFEEQKKLIHLFLSKKVDVYIVTASVAWGVEPGAKLLGINPENVIGIKTKIENGIVTSHQDGPITYREGKLTALLERTKGRKPFFASGNTMGDVTLLSASKVALAVGAAPESHELFSTEEQLRNKAIKQGWMIHKF